MKLVRKPSCRRGERVRRVSELRGTRRITLRNRSGPSSPRRPRRSSAFSLGSSLKYRPAMKRRRWALRSPFSANPRYGPLNNILSTDEECNLHKTASAAEVCNRPAKFELSPPTSVYLSFLLGERCAASSSAFGVYTRMWDNSRLSTRLILRRSSRQHGKSFAGSAQIGDLFREFCDAIRFLFR